MKKRFILLALVLVFCCLTSACETQHIDTYSSADPSEKAESIQELQPYVDYLNDRMNAEGAEDMRFQLVYINNDDIPELVLSEGSSHAAGAEVSTIVDSVRISVGTFGGYGTIVYEPKENLIVSNYFGMGIGDLRFNSMEKDGQYTELHHT